MLHSAEHVFVEFWPGVEVVESLHLISVLESLGAGVGGVRFEEHEFFALVFAELAAEEELLLGQLEGLADGVAAVDES